MKKKLSYEYEEISIRDRPIPKNSTAEASETLGVILKFIDIWLKLFDHNNDITREEYNIALKKLFQKIPTIKLTPISQGQKFQKLITEIGGGCCIRKITKGLPPLRRPTLSKNTRERRFN